MTVETMTRHDEKTSAGRAKMLSGGDTGDRLAEIDEVLECFVVQRVEHHEAELEGPTQCDPSLYSFVNCFHPFCHYS